MCPDAEWNIFDAEAAKLGLTCRYGYDMIYPDDTVALPQYAGMNVRLLTAEDMPLIKAFRQNGGCSECHVRAIQIYFDGKGNAGMKPLGLFADDELLCLAMPSLDHIREFKKYDIGAIFALKEGYKSNAIEMIWKYAIDFCLKDNAFIGNANALEEGNNPYIMHFPYGDPLSVEESERMGLIKAAKNCGYSKR